MSYAQAYKNIRAQQLAELEDYRNSFEAPAEEPDWMKEHQRRQNEIWALHARLERDEQVHHYCRHCVM